MSVTTKESLAWLHLSFKITTPARRSSHSTKLWTFGSAVGPDNINTRLLRPTSSIGAEFSDVLNEVTHVGSKEEAARRIERTA